MSSNKRRQGYAGREMKASEFKSKCLTIMDDVQERGGEVVITKRGRPVAKLVPVGDVAMSPIGFMRGTVVAEGDLVSPDPDAWTLEDE